MGIPKVNITSGTTHIIQNKMKFVYASLAALGTVSANFVTDMENVFDNMWVENYDGFTLNLADFYTGTFVDNGDGFTYTESFHFPGFDENKKFNCAYAGEFPQAGFNLDVNCNGFYDQMPVEMIAFWEALGSPDWTDGNQFNQFVWTESVKASLAGGSASVTINSSMNNDNDAATAVFNGSLTGNVGMSNGGQTASANINFDGETTFTGFSQSFTDENNMDAEVNFEVVVSDLPKCQTFLSTF